MRLVLVLAAVLTALAPARAIEKPLNGVALVIGQSDYAQLPALPNPANDARAMVKLLTDLGFDARAITDRDGKRLRRDLERFAEDAEGADVALIYYSGHGIEAAGENWLIPVDAGVGSLEDAEEALVPLSSVIDQLRENAGVTIVLLDACRTNPFPAGSTLKRTPTGSAERVGGSGLAAVRGVTAFKQQPKPAVDNLGMVVGFAAEPGLPALDGEAGGNSPYAAALLRHMGAMPGVEFGQLMRMVTEEVYLATGTRQRPWVNESLRRLLFFGLVPDEPEGVDGAITRERRQLLLTVADLPSVERVSVERTAAREGVKLDALYGVLRALGEDAAPQDPAQLEKLLGEQAGRLREMQAQRAALRTDDPELVALSTQADRAIGEGAIETARGLLDRAVARVEQTAPAVDALEDQLKAKRIADAAVYARRADASALVFAFRDAAADFGKAYELVARWDETVAWNYKNLQAEALRSHGDAHGDRAALEEALAAYQTVLDMVPNGVRNRDWAITRNNMAVVLNTIGEMEEESDTLLRARDMFAESMSVFEAEKDDVNWAAAKNNIGNILLLLGLRAGDFAMMEEGLAAYRAALDRRDRTKVPLDWANSQYNVGLAEFQIADPRGDIAGLERAEAAYRAALEVLTPQTPAEWGATNSNLGNTLNALGLARNDPAIIGAAIEAFEAALSVRDRETWPALWAATTLNMGNALSNLARHELGTDSIERAAAAYEAALTVFDRARQPLDWASAQSNLGVALQTIGQRKQDVPTLERSTQAMRAALEIYARERFPLDWAMVHNNLANTQQLLAVLSGDPAFYGQAAANFGEALEEYRRDRTPLQWAMTTASLADALQNLSNTESDTARLKESIQLRRDALEVLSPDNAAVDWAKAQNGLGTGLLNLSTREQRSDLLPEAMAAFEASTRVYTRETQPVQWAFAQNNIGDVHWSLAAQAGGGRDAYGKALARFETARETFAGLGFAPVVDLLDKKIAMIREALPK